MHTDAEAFIMTFSLNNFPRNDTKFKVALQWETEFLKIVQEFEKNSTTFDFAYMSEVKSNLAERFFALFSFFSLHSFFLFVVPFRVAQRSLEDEINRTTTEDIPIFMISYAVIFLYIAVALGEYTSIKRIWVGFQLLF